MRCIDESQNTYPQPTARGYLIETTDSEQGIAEQRHFCSMFLGGKHSTNRVKHDFYRDSKFPYPAGA